jgi:Flp pilus assembly protein TadG
MPAALLVVLVMASIAIDMSLVLLRQRQAVDLAAAAANDATTAAADDPRGLGSNRFAIDPARAQDVVDHVVAADELAPLVDGRPEVTVAGDQVEVELAVRAELIFARAIPGAPRVMVVHARATSRGVA